jgi:2-desacetyl-2-hydroxyethyl bacteriochlorophyllide A dehydrogenase
MNALVWEAVERMVLRDVPEPLPGEGDVLVRVGAVGICGSELEGYLGKMANRTPPLVMGHEFAGTVGEAADEHWRGKRVAVNPLVPCGGCEPCRDGRTNLCLERVIIGIRRPGAFAELVAVPQSSLLELPDDLPLETAALMEPLAVVVHAFGLGLRQGVPDRVLIVGAGSIGLLAVQVASLSAPATLVVTDLNAERLAHAGRLGATATAAGDQLDALLPDGADLVVDCVGAAATKRVAIRHVRPGGTVVLLGLHDDDTALPSHELIRREIMLTGSFTYSDRDVRRALALRAAGRVRGDGWTTTRPLADGPEAFHELVHAPGGQTKILLRP